MLQTRSGLKSSLSYMNSNYETKNFLTDFFQKTLSSLALVILGNRLSSLYLKEKKNSHHLLRFHRRRLQINKIIRITKMKTNNQMTQFCTELDVGSVIVASSMTFPNKKLFFKSSEVCNPVKTK